MSNLDTTDKRLLARLMSDISEEHWAAGWMSRLEFALWDIIHGGSPDYGMGNVSDEHIADLRALSERCGGWIIYGDEGETFVPLAEWMEMVEVDGGK